MEYIGAKNINYRGMNLNFHITNSTIHIECNSRIDEISIGNSYYVINNQQKQFPSGVFSIVEHKCEGDFDLDGDVDDSDLAVFVMDFGRTDCATGDTCEGDFDGDGDVDGSDLVVFAMNFERTDCS